MNLEIWHRSVSFARELRACLSEILHEPVPEPNEADHPVRLVKQWLAERNLGLFPIKAYSRVIARRSKGPFALAYLNVTGHCGTLPPNDSIGGCHG